MSQSLAEALQQAAWNQRETALNSALLDPPRRLPRLAATNSADPSLARPPLDSKSSPMAGGLSLENKPNAGAKVPLSDPADPLVTSVHRVVIDGREFSFAGNAVLCPCPDCQSPMTVRLWLGVGDCWRCGCALELEQQELQELRRQQPLPEPSRQLAPPAPATRAEKQVAAPGVTRPAAQSSRPDSAAESLQSELDELLEGSKLAQLVRGGVSGLPAWLVSFLLHLAILLLLAMIVLQQTSPESLRIVLSAFVDKSRTEGGEIRLDDLRKKLADDQLLPPEAEVAPEDAREFEQAVADARELASDPLPIAPLPDLDSVRKNLTAEPGRVPSFAVRDPRLRAELLEKAGGTTLTEAAVARGLRWLASVQNQDGSWSLANYERHARPGNEGDAAGTSLALLPFLGAGQTHEAGRYKSQVAKGLAWLIANQKRDGDLRANFNGQAGMYAHGQATIVLCEAFAMTGDEKLREPAQRAVDFIQRAQHVEGGWRYQPGEPGDTSVFGWQLMALQSARAARGGINVNKDTLQLADYYLDLASKPRGQSRVPAGALYRYLPNDGSFTPAMTAEGLLCRMYLGWNRNNPRLMAGVRWLVEEHLPAKDKPNLYYWYYGTQVLHHYGGREWEKWNSAVRDLLVASQQKTGNHPGSWEPGQFEWGAQGERIFVTSLAVCTLEVYYRHLPLFEPLVLDD